MNLNKVISTPIAMLIIVVIAALAGGVFYWQYKQVEIDIPGFSFSECTADSDCEYLECPSRNELGCNSVQNVKGRCMSGECKCKCVTPEYELPQSPSGDQLVYQGKVYVKTEQKYDEYIPEEHQVELEEGVIYNYKDDIYTLKAADPHHGSYVYVKWQSKPVGELEIDVSDWKTYTNDKYNFKIKYPKNWYYTTSDYETQLLVCFNPKEVSGDCTALLTVSWNTTLQKRYKKKKQFWTDNKSYSLTESVTTVDNIEGKLLDIDNPAGLSKSVLYEKEGYVFNFEIIAEEELLFEPMLSTFEFTK